MEKESKRRKRNADIQKAVLDVVAAAGLLSVALVAPNVLVAFKKMGLLPNRRRKDSIRLSRERLVFRGLLVYEGNKLRLTPLGEKYLHTLALRDYKIPTPKRWDGKWRVLTFDIPERRKSTRDKIRHILAQAGLARLQDSVWLYPYPCEDLITLLKAEMHVGKDILYMIVDMLEYDGMYRKLFKLPLN